MLPSETVMRLPLLLQAKSWPAGLYSGPGLVEAVVGRMKRGGTEAESRKMWLLLAYLYETQVG